MDRADQIRRNPTTYFVVIGAGSVLILITAIIWLSLRVDQQAFSHVVLIVGSATFAIAGLVILVSNRFNTVFNKRINGSGEGTPHPGDTEKSRTADI